MEMVKKERNRLTDEEIKEKNAKATSNKMRIENFNLGLAVEKDQAKAIITIYQHMYRPQNRT